MVQAKTATEAEINRLEQRRLELEAQLDKGRRDMERANEELKLYVSGVADGKGRSVRDRLQQQIVEQEKTHGQLQEEQRHLKEQLPRLESQVQHWQRLEKYVQPWSAGYSSNLPRISSVSLRVHPKMNWTLISTRPFSRFPFKFGADFNVKLRYVISTWVTRLY